ncbi:DUF3016 domain-containing protein [Shewanella eurypsychrophilus]|uniref:DUF3016 domain-containing protein n=1 Tax=Shewanella eurypsychrophilus TaxID=2593656 RepID=A0ABX6VAX4_9GAMM|nr:MULTISPECIES: DUF3016 domain-containing protein [Shewanella]QFU24608.1 DUF3016 domain-containing protein [Shewanella sp. YLB-09]QPG59805.1 DUF3016 domain-containing protein [Shewanella eurypsychrophilus]
MKFTHLLLAGTMVSGAALSGIAVAEEVVENPVTEQGMVKITWQDPKSFRDVKAASDIQSRYEARTFETLTKNLNKEAGKILKPEQKLEMIVTDLDLAGDVRPTFGATMNDIRVIQDIYPPRITFSYSILEGDKVVMVGDEKLTDLGFMHTVGRMNDKPLRFEDKLLADWMKKTVKPKL